MSRDDRGDRVKDLAGPEVLELLMPQRRPLWMVDVLVAWDDQGGPTLRAARHISANEEVFGGHFPELAMWPGTFTIEGLAQTCRALATLERLARACDRATVVASLANLGRSLRREPGFDPDAARRTASDIAALQGPGLLAAIDVRLTRPVRPGCRLDYRCVLGRELGDLVRFDVEASVAGEPVAHGSLTTARGPR